MNAPRCNINFIHVIYRHKTLLFKFLWQLSSKIDKINPNIVIYDRVIEALQLNNEIGEKMYRKLLYSFVISLGLSFLLLGCDLDIELFNENDDSTSEVTSLNDLENTKYFRDGALEHILEGELNKNRQAVGYHYDQLPTKKGSIVEGTETKPNQYGVYEAEVIVNDVKKTSNNGKSTFFPDDWDSQDVVDAINEAYQSKTFINGNTFEGLSEEGIAIRMYLDNEEQIISAFPVY